MKKPKTRFCIKCEKEIKPLYPETRRKPENSMWMNGIVSKIYAGYGSDFDTLMLIICICDKCIKSNKNLVEHVGNYI